MEFVTEFVPVHDISEINGRAAFVSARAEGMGWWPGG